MLTKWRLLHNAGTDPKIGHPSDGLVWPTAQRPLLVRNEPERTFITML
jgi:hypothetical protein